MAKNIKGIGVPQIAYMQHAVLQSVHFVSYQLFKVFCYMSVSYTLLFQLYTIQLVNHY